MILRPTFMFGEGTGYGSSPLTMFQVQTVVQNQQLLIAVVARYVLQQAQPPASIYKQATKLR